MSGQPPCPSACPLNVRFAFILVVWKLEGEKGFAVVAIQVEFTAIDDVHADDGVVVAEVGLVNLLIGDDIARRKRDVHEVCITLGLSANAYHATFAETFGRQFADECRREDGGVAACVPHGTEGFHPPFLVKGDELALGDHFVGQRAEVDAKASHSVRGVQTP